MTKKISTQIKYYKLVTSHLRSIGNLAGSEIYPLSVQYSFREFSRGKYSSGLYVFDSLKFTRQFKNKYISYDHCYIYEVEVKQEIKPIFVDLRESYEFIVRVLKQHQQKKKYLKLLNRYQMPKGTKCFKQVKLIKKVN